MATFLRELHGNVLDHLGQSQVARCGLGELLRAGEEREEDVRVLERGLLQEALQVLLERPLLLLQHVEASPGEELRPRWQLGVLELGHGVEGRELGLEVVELGVSPLDGPVQVIGVDC